MKSFFSTMRASSEVSEIELFSNRAALFLSSSDYLHEPLERFIETLPVKTVLLRNERRLGLISSRVKGSFSSSDRIGLDRLLSLFSGEDRHGTNNHVSRFARRSAQRVVVVSSGRNTKGSVSERLSLLRFERESLE
jgi:hypothetical protein